MEADNAVAAAQEAPQVVAEIEAAVKNDEVYARWIYQPRFMNTDEVLAESYVSMRERNGNPKGPEDGISGMLISRCSHELVVETGVKHKWKPKKNKPEEIFWGYGKAIVGDIRSIAEKNDVVDVEESPSESVPHHAIITFHIEGERQRGNTPHPRMRRYKERLLALFDRDKMRV